MPKENRKQINLRLEPELYKFLAKYADDHYKSVTAVVRDMIVNLYEESRKAPLVVRGN